MTPSRTKLKPEQFNVDSPLVKAIKLTIVIAAIGVVLCFVFLATEH